MERGTYQIETYREGIPIGRPEPYTGFLLNAGRLALKKGRRSNADFVRVLEGRLELWSERLDS
jgi:hypothetical protein